ncbi:hypothetical protein HDU76_005440 [Blyttiomyces sp. JEL0837]|nr:hypothetical protein HDU76_005440 [Blyttiomyces sp. JEL0837]
MTVNENAIETVSRQLQRLVSHSAEYHQFSNAEHVKLFQDQLLSWFDLNQRELPWRKPPLEKAVEGQISDELAQRAYEVWVSEIMSQQTQIATMIPFYNKWMANWPTVYDLAKADLEDVNKVWSGLGYYSRAQRLHQGAQLVVSKFDGRLPRDAEALEKEIPGIGPYTAGAISSIAYMQPSPLVDGNVIRVLARQRAIMMDSKSKAAVSLYWQLAKDILPASRPGDFNQALMELGATVCLPQVPKCTGCPVASTCRALAEKKAHEAIAAKKFFGGKKSKQEVVPIEDPCEMCTPDIADIEDFSVTRYPPVVNRKPPRQEGLLAGLWDFPTIQIPTSTTGNTKVTGSPSLKTRQSLADKHLSKIFSEFRSAKPTSSPIILNRKDLGDCLHIFSHVRRTMWVEVIDVEVINRDDNGEPCLPKLMSATFEDPESAEENSGNNKAMDKKQRKGGVKKKDKNDGKENTAGHDDATFTEDADVLCVKWMTEADMMSGAVPATLKKAFGLLTGKGAGKARAKKEGDGSKAFEKSSPRARKGKVKDVFDDEEGVYQDQDEDEDDIFDDNESTTTTQQAKRKKLVDQDIDEMEVEYKAVERTRSGRQVKPASGTNRRPTNTFVSFQLHLVSFFESLSRSAVSWENIVLEQLYLKNEQLHQKDEQLYLKNEQLHQKDEELNAKEEDLARLRDQLAKRSDQLAEGNDVRLRLKRATLH